MTRRLPVIALGVLIVGLALHNLAMATLWEWGIRGTELDVLAAWKECCSPSHSVWQCGARVACRRCRRRTCSAVYAGIIVVYALVRAGWTAARRRTASCLRCATI